MTGTPRFQAAVYASDTVPGSIREWTRVSGVKKVRESERIPLDTAGHKFRNYLLWISELPPQNKANVLELSLKG